MKEFRKGRVISHMISLFFTQCLCDRFAILFAGSNGWSNYRHQADVFTLYCQLVERGFKEENIVLMAYNDVVNHDSNPFKGQMFHSDLHNKNIYPGVDKITIRGNAITDIAFYKLLSTDLKSTTDDYLYIYYDNHGGSGVLGLPGGDHMYADDIANAFAQMEQNGKYKYCLFGLETCYAGSVAEKLTNKNMVTICSSNAEERSAADVWDSDMFIYLSNEMTSRWVVQMDENQKQTLGDFYDNVKDLTKESHVTWYGDESMRSITIDNWFGSSNKVARMQNPSRVSMPVSNEVATLSSLLGLQKSDNPTIRAQARLELLKLESLTKKFDIAIEEIIKIVDSKNASKYMTTHCGSVTSNYLKVLRHFIGKIGEYNPDDMSKFSYLNNLAAAHSAETIIAAIDKVL